LISLCEIGNGPGNFKYPNKDLLYVEHAYPKFVPTVTINWEEIRDIGGLSKAGRAMRNVAYPNLPS